ncbi:hypothetical protein QQX98_005786 [Neonectria punicea]|uniref:Velvet domain-containing protein n=1 Tax=Neonectria punicea TaxID=979145 RepID=A0ABR1H341_9HYPO
MGPAPFVSAQDPPFMDMCCLPDQQQAFPVAAVPAGSTNNSRGIIPAASPTDSAPDQMGTWDIPSPGQGTGISDASANGTAHARYSLRVRQQPKTARSCGFSEKDRRMINPPPIVQLHIDGPGLTEQDVSNLLRDSGYIMNCRLYDKTGTRDDTHIHVSSRHPKVAVKDFFAHLCLFQLCLG